MSTNAPTAPRRQESHDASMEMSVDGLASSEGEGSQELSIQEDEEIELYRIEDRLQVAAERNEASEHTLTQKNEEYLSEVDEMLRRFPSLPPEIQIRIWFWFARSDTQPKMHIFAQPYGLLLFLDHGRLSNLDFSSLLCYDDESTLDLDSEYGANGLPTCLEVCIDSRKEALKVFAEVSYGRFQRRTYINAEYDVFYLGAEHWSTLLLSYLLMMKTLATAPLSQHLQNRLQNSELMKVRNLVVDINIFADAPIQLWTEFSSLKELVIAFYPYRYMDVTDFTGHVPGGIGAGIEKITPILKCPCEGSIHEVRASVILESATASFAALKMERPDWQTPEIIVKLISNAVWRKHAVHRASVSQSELDSSWNSDSESESESESTDVQPYDDSRYLKQLRRLLSRASLGVDDTEIDPEDPEAHARFWEPFRIHQHFSDIDAAGGDLAGLDGEEEEEEAGERTTEESTTEDQSPDEEVADEENIVSDDEGAAT